MKYFLICLLALTTLCIAGCGEKDDDILKDISGVWGVQGETGLFSIIYQDKKISLLVDDQAIPVVLGEIDNENDTVNLKVTLKDGKPGIWTLRQIWDKDHKAFHLQFTFHDGSQASLSFVRKISTDDLNRIANAEARIEANAVQTAATASVEANRNLAPPPETATDFSDDSAITPDEESSEEHPEISWTPSFDCAKASNEPERLICSNRDLSEADVNLSQAYKVALDSSQDKEALKKEQNAWRQFERDACPDVDCMALAYQKRIAQLSQ